MNKIKVGMADLKLGNAPDLLVTLGLGSCVGVVMYDGQVKVAGMAHVMLPDSNQIKNNQNPAKFADTACAILLDELLKKGCLKGRLIVKIAGGAQMFSFNSGNDLMKIGERNILAVKNVIGSLGLRIVSEDTGGNYGRTVEFDTIDGSFTIRTIGHGVKVI